MINATQPLACDGGVSDRGMRVINRFASAYRRGLRPYLARCLTAIAKRTGGVSRAGSGASFFFRLGSRSGVGPGGLVPLLRIVSLQLQQIKRAISISSQKAASVFACRREPAAR